MTSISAEDISKFGPEWIILEQITKGNSDTIISQILLEYQLDWGELIEQAMNHKLFPMVAHHFLSEENFKYVPPFVNQYFRVAYDINRHKTKIIKAETKIICHQLMQENISFVCTKGTVLDRLLYDSLGYRFLSDADFIVHPRFKPTVTKVMDELGFQTGSVNWMTNEARLLTREEHLVYLNTGDKLPEFIKRTDDAIIKYVSAGFVTSLTWKKCIYPTDIEAALRHTHIYNLDDGDVIGVPVLNTVNHFIYIILHLYKHAWLEYLARWNNDVNLVKFGDVYRYWRKFHQDLVTELPPLLKGSDIYKPILWTLEHTDRIFGSDIVDSLCMKGLVSEEYLHSAGDKTGAVRRWNGNMRQRLAHKQRWKVFETEC